MVFFFYFVKWATHELRKPHTETSSASNISDCPGLWESGLLKLNIQVQQELAGVRDRLHLREPAFSSHQMSACHWTEVYVLRYEFYSKHLLQ